MGKNGNDEKVEEISLNEGKRWKVGNLAKMRKMLQKRNYCLNKTENVGKTETLLKDGKC